MGLAVVWREEGTESREPESASVEYVKETDFPESPVRESPSSILESF